MAACPRVYWVGSPRARKDRAGDEVNLTGQADYVCSSSCGLLMHFLVHRLLIIKRTTKIWTKPTMLWTIWSGFRQQETAFIFTPHPVLAIQDQLQNLFGADLMGLTMSGHGSAPCLVLKVGLCRGSIPSCTSCTMPFPFFLTFIYRTLCVCVTHPLETATGQAAAS